MHDEPIPFQRVPHRTQFFLLRHGESEGNRRRMIQGHVDMPLTDVGRDHARAAGKYFSRGGLDHILSSPLSRARETAEIVASSLANGSGQGPEPQISFLDCLKELDTGIFSGLTVSEIQEQFPEEWDAFTHRSWEAVPSAERLEELLARAAETWEAMIQAAEGGARNVLAVSHGGMIQWLFKLTFSDRWSSWLPVTRTGNCGIYQLVVTPVPGDLSPEGPGFYAEWLKVNHLPYQR
jgi:broad specificity phosphatase PhoE